MHRPLHAPANAKRSPRTQLRVSQMNGTVASNEYYDNVHYNEAGTFTISSSSGGDLLDPTNDVSFAQQQKQADHLRENEGNHGEEAEVIRMQRMSDRDVEISTGASFSSHSSRCRIILRFLKESTMYERMVSKIVGSPVHCDIILDREGTDDYRFAYSAYVNEEFSMTFMPNEMIDNDNYISRQIRVTPQEFQRCKEYLHCLVNNKIKYNYTDAMIIMPTMPSAGEFIDTMVPDIDASNPTSIKKLYCSQACLLVLRENLNEVIASQLLKVLKPLNSRLTSPCKLFHVVEHHSRPMQNRVLLPSVRASEGYDAK